MSTITREQQEKIESYLKDRHIPSGLGTKEEACSVQFVFDALQNVLNRFQAAVPAADGALMAHGHAAQAAQGRQDEADQDADEPAAGAGIAADLLGALDVAMVQHGRASPLTGTGGIVERIFPHPQDGRA